MPNWWNKKYGKNSTCAITRNRLRSGKNKHGLTKAFYLDCKHGFCRSALQSWILTNPSQQPTCPMCRKEFDPIPVFIK